MAVVPRQVVVDISGQTRLQVTALQLDRLFPGPAHVGLPGPAPAAESCVLGPWDGVQSEKQVCALFPSPSCPSWVWALVCCFLEFSLGTNTFKNCFRSLRSIQKVGGGFLYPLYLDLLGGYSSKVLAEYLDSTLAGRLKALQRGHLTVLSLHINV